MERWRRKYHVEREYNLNKGGKGRDNKHNKKWSDIAKARYRRKGEKKRKK